MGEGYFMTYLYVDVLVVVIQQGEQSDFSTVGPRHRHSANSCFIMNGCTQH